MVFVYVADRLLGIRVVEYGSDTILREEYAMTAEILYEKIGLPASVRERLTGKTDGVPKPMIAMLTDFARAEEGYLALARLLGEDDMAMLACQLEAAAICCEKMTALGVPEAVMVETMKCFSRFLGETLEMTGQERFDREWWTWRQTGGRLLRIGQLEYELVPEGKTVSLHIPSDAVFTPEKVDASLALARELLDRVYPDWSGADYVCHSWLLSPELGKLLKSDSNILAFQNRFHITRVEPDARDFIGWLFRMKEDTPVEALPETTSLQRSVKQLLLSGGSIGCARGVLL